MTYSLSQDDLRGTGADAGRREWIRPAVRRLSAGSAEDGGGPTDDAGVNPS